MKNAKFVFHLVLSGAMCAVVAGSLAAPISASIVEIQFTGMNLTYDGSAIYDGGSTAGGVGDPADADPLSSVDFFVDGLPAGSLSSDISLDVYIPDVTGISAAANTVYSQTTPGNPGYFDLLIGTSPLASEFVIIDLSEVTVTYVDVLNLVQFTFGAAVGDIFGQNLPFGLAVGDPVTVSFSSQLTPGTKTDNGVDITGFDATGTGEIQGTLVPEPATCLLAAFGLIGCLAVRRK